jgi:hypothetical protein
MAWFSRGAGAKRRVQLEEWHRLATMPAFERVQTAAEMCREETRAFWLYSSIDAVVKTATSFDACVKGLRRKDVKRDLWTEVAPEVAAQAIPFYMAYQVPHGIHEMRGPGAPELLRVLPDELETIFPGQTSAAILCQLSCSSLLSIVPGGFFLPSGVLTHLVRSALRGEPPQLEDVRVPPSGHFSEAELLSQGLTNESLEDSVELHVLMMTTLASTARIHGPLDAYERNRVLRGMCGLALETV